MEMYEGPKGNASSFVDRYKDIMSVNIPVVLRLESVSYGTVVWSLPPTMSRNMNLRPLANKRADQDHIRLAFNIVAPLILRASILSGDKKIKVFEILDKVVNEFDKLLKQDSQDINAKNLIVRGRLAI